MNLPRLLALLVSLESLVSARAQLPQPLAEKWVARIAGSAGFADIPSAVATDADGNVYVSGHVGASKNTYKAVVAKFDGSTGALLWRWESERVVNGDGGTGAPTTSRYTRMKVAPDGDLLVLFSDEGLLKFRSGDGAVAWSTQSNEVLIGYDLDLDFAGDAIVVGGVGGYVTKPVTTKYRYIDGVPLWTYKPAGVLLRTVKADPEGNVIVSGRGNSTDYSGVKLYTAKLSGVDGTAIWTVSASLDPLATQGARLLALDEAGGITVATYDRQLLRYRASDGTLLWKASNLETPYAVTSDPIGNVYLSTANGLGSSSTIRRFNAATGIVQWTLNGSPSIWFVQNLAMRDGELIAMGSGMSNLQLNSLDPQLGRVRWSREYDSGGVDVASTYSIPRVLMASQPDGGIAISGVSGVSGSTYPDIATVRFAPGPSATNPSPQWVLRTSARLRFKGGANGMPATYHWEYGPTVEYGNSTPEQSLALTNFQVSHAFTIEGLAENSLYHARAVAVNANGTTESQDITFTTGWDANANFLPDEWELAEWGNTSPRLATADDDKDGLANLLEYALDRHPRKPDSADATPVVLEDGYLSVTLTKRPFVELSVEVSGDSIKWVPAVVVLDTSKTLKARDKISVSGAASRFLRVRANPVVN